MSTASLYMLDYADDENATMLRVLAPSVRVADVARVSRAALEMLVANAERWTKRELARWLVDAYREATALGGHDDGDDEAPPPSSRSGAVQDEALRRVMSAAMAEVVAARRALAIGGESARASVERAMARGWVEAVCDVDGVRGFAPRAQGAFTLAERLVSLLIAGYAAERRDDFVDTPSTTGVRIRRVM